MSISIRPIFVLCLCVLAPAAPALAQPAGADRPYRGLFGSARGPVASQTLDLTVSLVEAYDDDVLGDDGSLVAPVFRSRGGFFTTLVAGSRYQWLGKGVQLNANLASAFAYYNGLSRLQNISHTAAAGFGGQLGRARVTANQAVAYSPSYLYGLFPSVDDLGPGTALPFSPDYDVSDTRSYSYITGLSIAHPVTRRGSVSLGASYTYADFQGAGASTRPDVSAYRIQTSFSRNLTRNSSMSLGYGYRGGNLSGDGIASTPVAHGLDVGANYSRPLSATRRAVFGMTFGSSAISPTGGATPVDSERRYRAHGNVSFGYQFSARWQAKATYRRELQYVSELAEPVFTDGLTVAIDGLLTPRMDFGVGARYSNGSSALASSDDAATFNTYTADARLRYALTMTWALYVSYLYYFYEFNARTPFSATVPPALQRNGVRVGVSLWLPLLRR